MRKGDEDWVKKCMEYRVEGRSLVGRPRKTWLESVEADMAELEINKEDHLPQLTYDMTTTKPDGPLPTTRKQTGHNLQKTQSPHSLRPPYLPTYTLPTAFPQTSY